MAHNHHLPPSASCLSASMRDLGYSLETAVADLVDNSISAEATLIEIICDASAALPSVVILDNGRGMDPSELIQAMKHGAVNPREVRSPKDLGRFGLGLKTASFSQCRSLTVATARHSIRSAAEWNLDLIDRSDDWFLSIFDNDEIADLPYSDRLGDHGTVVIWRALDRLVEDETGNRRAEIVNEKLDILERHLSLVFHRFLSGEVRGRKKVAITVNGHSVEPFDPFCRKNAATQMLPEEIVRIGDDAVQLQPFILPHHSRLTAAEYDFYNSRSDFISNQGAYIYRNGRLMAWGDWFRLIPKGEATKLARVQIDFPNSLDESWTIDIKKSRARPPFAVRERLRQIISQVSGRSTTVHRGRGQKLFQEVQAPLWERYSDHGGIRYTLNSSHPLVQALSKRLNHEGSAHLALLLEAAGAAVPVEMIYSDYSTHPRETGQSADDEATVTARLKALKEALSDNGSDDPVLFREILRSTKLFERHMDAADEFIRKEFA